MYSLFASVYDEINAEIDYPAWAGFINEIIKRNYGKGKPELVLDLGCGTGSMTLELAKLGYDMTGIDNSPEMLGIARERAEELNLGDKMLWLLQDMTDFELYGTVDVAVSCLDCINHLTTRSELERCLSLVHNYLVPDGLFIFDVNGKGKFERIYGNECYVMENDGSFLTWQNFYNPKSGLCDFVLTLFTEREDGLYERSEDFGKEKMYTLRTLRSALAKCGFEFIGAYSDFEFKEAEDNDERIYIAARCIKKEG